MHRSEVKGFSPSDVFTCGAESELCLVCFHAGAANEEAVNCGILSSEKLCRAQHVPHADYQAAAGTGSARPLVNYH